MLTLTLEAPGPRRPPANGAGRPSTAPLRTWWEDGGEVGVVDVARVGRFRFHRADGGVVAVPGPGVPHDTVDAAFAGTVLPLALQARGEHLLHASAVVTEAGAAAFCGRSGTGKSTLAHGLARRGLPQWADDAVLLRAGGDSAGGADPGAVRTLPLPWRARLRPDVRRHLGHDARQAPTQGGDAASSSPAGQPLWRIFTVTRRAGRRGVRAVRLTPADALPMLVDNAYRFDGGAHRTRALLVTCLDLAAAVPVFRLELPDDLGGLHPTLDAVADLLRRSADGWHTPCA